MGRPAWEIRKKDKERVAKLRELGYDVEVVHECEIREQLKTCTSMKEFFDNCEFAVSKILPNHELFEQEPLDVKDAFFGGRTEVFVLYRGYNNVFVGNYLDVTSLYP